MLTTTPALSTKSLITFIFKPAKYLITISLLLITMGAASTPESTSTGNAYYKKLLAQYFISLKEDERSNDLAAKAEDLNNIGNIYYTLRNYEKSLSYYRMSLDAYKAVDMPDAMYGQYFSLSKVYRDLKQYDSSWICLSRTIRYFRKSDDNAHNLMFAYYYSGELYHSQLQYKVAEQYYDSAMTMGKKVNNVVLFLECLEGKSQILQETKDNRKSIDNAFEGLKVSEKSGDLDFSMKFRYLLYLNYKNLNKPELAFQNLEAYHKLNDSVRSKNAFKAFTDMASSYEAVARLKENEILKQQNRNYLLAQKFYITALVLGLLLIATLLLLARQQRRNIRFKNEIIQHEKRIKSQLINTIDNEKIKKSELITDHQQALETVVQEKSQITDELERKNNDLLTATTYMIKTNEKLAEISSNFKNIASKLQKSSSLNGEIYQTIEAIEKLSTKDTWDNFRNKFVDVHPNFFKNLNERCPGMTQNELKLAAMISMNLSSKDIAKITMQQHNSVNVARYRLRKKLNMESDDQLIGFLLQL